VSRASACLVLLLVAVLGHTAEVTAPPSTEVVVDQAGVIDQATTGRVTALLVHLRELTTAEVKVLTVQSLNGEEPVSFAQRHYDAWQLGARGKDNGALILLAVADHAVRIHTGYGLEGALPDAWCGTLSRRIATQRFRSGAYAAGIEELAEAVAAKVAAEANVDLGASGGAATGRPPPQGSPPVLFILILVGIGIVMSVIRSRNGGGGWSGPSGSIGRSGSFGGGYGGFGGGGGSSGGGGFSGGGGRSGGGGGGASW